MNEICLGHIIPNMCPDCSEDEKNKECKGYIPVTVHWLEVFNEQVSTQEQGSQDNLQVASEETRQ
jgi:hypothetical protein